MNAEIKEPAGYSKVHFINEEDYMLFKKKENFFGYKITDIKEIPGDSKRKAVTVFYNDKVKKVFKQSITPYVAFNKKLSSLT